MDLLRRHTVRLSDIGYRVSKLDFSKNKLQELIMDWPADQQTYITTQQCRILHALVTHSREKDSFVPTNHLVVVGKKNWLPSDRLTNGWMD